MQMCNQLIREYKACPNYKAKQHVGPMSRDKLNSEVEVRPNGKMVAPTNYKGDMIHISKRAFSHSV